MTTSYPSPTDPPIVRTPRELGDLVRQARLEAGLTQAELAEDAQVGRQWLVGFEAGAKASAPLAMIWRLLDVLDLQVTLAPPLPPRSSEEGSRRIISASEVLARYAIADTENMNGAGERR
ncbi:MAG: helix-turn-helix domain-containing protein [Propionibacteriaceae bacterium]|jgi:transcriptional regulator with XRE-family HTH domain|nr:helix-turn-helix domain-containing protein [Propionibacteriaceae bacterium]